MTTTDTCTKFFEGVALFNSEDFFEAHEVWEELWMESIGQEHLNYQGFIQITACFLQVQRGFFDGSRKLYTKALDKFKKAETEFNGIHIRNFLDEVYAIVAGLPPDKRGKAMSHLCSFPKITANEDHNQ